jgi:tripartite-type tricarboxylate transporter receptor subunit TctC
MTLLGDEPIFLATTGVRTLDNIAGALLREDMGFDLVRVHHEGTGPAVTALLSERQ